MEFNGAWFVVIGAIVVGWYLVRRLGTRGQRDSIIDGGWSGVDSSSGQHHGGDSGHGGHHGGDGGHHGGDGGHHGGDGGHSGFDGAGMADLAGAGTSAEVGTTERATGHAFSGARHSFLLRDCPRVRRRSQVRRPRPPPSVARRPEHRQLRRLPIPLRVQLHRRAPLRSAHRLVRSGGVDGGPGADVSEADDRVGGEGAGHCGRGVGARDFRSAVGFGRVLGRRVEGAGVAARAGRLSDRARGAVRLRHREIGGGRRRGVSPVRVRRRR